MLGMITMKWIDTTERLEQKLFITIVGDKDNKYRVIIRKLTDKKFNESGLYGYSVELRDHQTANIVDGTILAFQAENDLKAKYIGLNLLLDSMTNNQEKYGKLIETIREAKDELTK